MDPISILTSAVLFVFGLIIGSFLNVVIFRANTGMSVAKGRSACFSCGKTLEWYEIIPLASFLMQRGACRKCGSKISWQYPVVELAGGLAFVAAYAVVPSAFSGPWTAFAVFALSAALLCLYIVIVAYDLRHKIIPDLFSYSAALVALGLFGISSLTSGAIDPFRAVAGPTLFLFFWFFWYVSRGRWMGLGDGKLALSVGWALGLSPGIAALLMSFWIGAIVSLLVMGFQSVFSKKRRLGLKSAIPFGPFLVLGFLIAFLWHADIQGILSYLAL